MSKASKFFSFFFKQITYQYAIKRVQKKMLLIYLKTLRSMRTSLLVAFAAFFILQLMCMGFVGASVTAIWLYPTADLDSKLYLFLCFFIALFLVPALGLVILFSDRFWFRLSGAQKMMTDLE